MDFQSNQARTNDYQIKRYNSDSEEINSQKIQYELELQLIQKANLLKKRLEAFVGIKTLNEAKEIAQKVIPISGENSSFKVGNAKCIVINKENMLRISYDSPTEFISYDFE